MVKNHSLYLYWKTPTELILIINKDEVFCSSLFIHYTYLPTLQTYISWYIYHYIATDGDVGTISSIFPWLYGVERHKQCFFLEEKKRQQICCEIKAFTESEDISCLLLQHLNENTFINVEWFLVFIKGDYKFFLKKTKILFSLLQRIALVQQSTILKKTQKTGRICSSVFPLYSLFIWKIYVKNTLIYIIIKHNFLK